MLADSQSPNLSEARANKGLARQTISVYA